MKPVTTIKPEQKPVDPDTVARYHAMVDRLVAMGASSIVMLAETNDGFARLSEPDLACVREGMARIFADISTLAGTDE